MHLILNEEEQMVRDSAVEFLTSQAGPTALRELRDNESQMGYSTELWQEMIELGWPSVLIPEENGGLGFSHTAMGQISEQTGHTLACSPLFATAVVSASILELAGTDQQKSELLPAVASGEVTLALALDEMPRHEPGGVAMTAVAKDGTYILNGYKCFVVDGHTADQLIVAARTSGDPGETRGITLFLVPRETDGIEVSRTPMVDSRNAAEIRFTNVSVGEDGIVGNLDQGVDVLEPVLNIANTHLAAELLGIADECFKQTLAYLKERSQFGVKIGTFQALQHRAAIVWMEIELCKSIVLKTLRALDESPDNNGLLASMAKAKACKVAELATNESIQMHGGIGMTDEFDIGFYLKRARVVQMLYGDHRFHLNRVAELSNY